MRSHNKRVLLFIVVIVSVVTAMGALRGRQQQTTTSSKKDDPTPRQEMTDKQRRHSKLYERPARKDLRKTRESVTIVATVPFIDSDDEKLPPTIEELLRRPICTADAVVVGTVDKKTAQFTENGGFIFTDHEVRVEDVLASNLERQLQRNETLTVTRPGGAIEFNGRVARVIDKAFEPMIVSGTYLLFLRYIPATGAFRAVNSDSSFQLEQSVVRRLSARELPYPLIYQNEPSTFLLNIRAIADSCDKQTRGDAK